MTKKLSEQEAAEIADAIDEDEYKIAEVLPRDQWPINRGRGRPSLTGGTGESPRVTFRADPALIARAREVAEREHKTVAQVAREALEEHVSS